MIEDLDVGLDADEPGDFDEVGFSTPPRPSEFMLSFPPPVDGFVNPLSPTAFVDEVIGGIDIYYNANDWTHNGGHCGEDWNYTSGGSSDLGEDVYATANGIVQSAANYGGAWGNIVI